MNRIVGGNGFECGPNQIYVDNGIYVGCVCYDGYIMENVICTPVDAEGFTRTLFSICKDCDRPTVCDLY